MRETIRGNNITLSILGKLQILNSYNITAVYFVKSIKANLERKQISTRKKKGVRDQEPIILKLTKNILQF